MSKFNPKYAITPVILENIKKIAEIKTELNTRRFLDVVKVQMEARADDLSVHSSTSIEGNPLPLTEVKKVLKTRPEHLRDSEREVLNYNAALDFLKSRLEEGRVTLDKELVLKIHSCVMEELLPQESLGSYRRAPVVVNDPRSGEVMYIPPNVEDAVPLMEELLTFVDSQRSNLDPIILAGLFHKQFVVIHPFVDGNGRSVRLLTKVLLADLGLDTFNLFSFENYYNRNVSLYFKNVGLYGDYYELRESGGIEYTGWLEYFSEGIVDELLRVRGELAHIGIDPSTALRDQDKAIMRYLQHHDFITDSDYAKLTDRAKSTRAKDFERLIGLGLLERKGKGRATYYVLSQV